MSESDGEARGNSRGRLLLKARRLVLPFLDRSRDFAGVLSWKRKMLLLVLGFALVMVLGVIAGVYLYHLPVLIVTDSSFMALYGQKRLEKSERRLSRKFFRRIIPVYVDENAGPDVIPFAVEDAFPAPLAVLFPHRYMESAGYYKENHPDIPVYVASGRNHSPTEKEAVFVVRTDVKTDLYRAGLCAALLAGEQNIIFVSNGTVPDENKEAFAEGLRAQGYTGDPTYRNANYNFSSGGDLGCAVIMGQSGDFFEKRPTTPVILFSWSDPGIVPRSVKVVFDDSPYALAYRGLALASSTKEDGGGEFFISSVPTVFKDRNREKADFNMLENLVKKEFKNKKKKTALKSIFCR
jgi:hypothetical protein